MAEIDEKPIIELDKYTNMVDVLQNNDVVAPLRDMVLNGARNILVKNYDSTLTYQEQVFRLDLTTRYEDGSRLDTRFQLGIKFVWSEALKRPFIKVRDLRAGSESLEPYWFDTGEPACLVPFDRFQLAIPRTYGSFSALRDFNISRSPIYQEYPIKVMLDKSKAQDDVTRYYYVNMVLGIQTDFITNDKMIIYFFTESYKHNANRDNILVKNKTNLMSGF